MTCMTHIKEKKRLFTSLLPLFCVVITIIMLALGEEIKRGIASGIGLSFTNIIPTLFPFFIF